MRHTLSADTGCSFSNLYLLHNLIVSLALMLFASSTECCEIAVKRSEGALRDRDL